MAWALSTDAILTAIRTAIGDTLTVSGTTLTWTKKVEGEPLRWLGATADYPLIILQPADTDADSGPKLLPLDLQVDVVVALEATRAGSSGVAPAAYKTARVVGEGVVAKIMDAGPRIGTTWLQRRLISCGVDYDLCEALNDHGLLVYRARFGFRYFEQEVLDP